LDLVLVSRHGGRLRFRVRGLLGNAPLARTLESQLRLLLPPAATATASPASGTLLLSVPRSSDEAASREALARVLAGAGLRQTTAPADIDARRDAPPPGSAPAAHRRESPGQSSARSRRSQAPAPQGATPHPAEPATVPGPAAAAPARSVAAPAAPAAGEAPHAQSLAQLLARIDAHEGGLASTEAVRRLARDGPNEVADITGRSALEILAGQFLSVPVGLLAGSGGLALATRAFGDAAAIGAVLAANAGIGFVTERRAEQTVSSLRKLAPREATVLRDGQAVQVPAREIVVGDVLLLRPGEPVAADARVIEAHRLSANEAPLTGESLPMRKAPCDALPADAPVGERGNMLHMGTVVSGGTGRAVVVATGGGTMLGAIRAMAQGAEAPRTRLQVELDGLGRQLAIGSAALCVGVFGLGLLRGRPALPLLRTVVSLGVAAIPEGLPAVATSLLASGIRSLQQRRVYARSLDAVENLGAVDTVCFDKTGTITENRMSASVVTLGLVQRRVDAGESPSLPQDWLRVALLCNEVDRNGEGWSGSSTEIALVELAQRLGGDWEALRSERARLALKERSEHHPYMATLHADPEGGGYLAVKGRPAEVLERCERWFDGGRVVVLRGPTRARLLAINDALAEQGNRVLALAFRRQPDTAMGETGGLTWLGMVGLADPIRPGMELTIERFRRAGIRPMVITGDQPGTARAVSAAIGLPADSVADAASLPETVEGVLEASREHSVFARSTPGMKLQVVRALQRQGHVVAMTGDGINDGPALKTADVGVAMGATGTDFAHAMSDLVLRDDHPDGLLMAIAEGRTAYLNVKKAVRYLLATNLSELAATTIAIGAGLPEPFDPLALLWTNLITDVSPAIALGLEPPEPDILDRPPLKRDGGMLDAADWRSLATDGALLTVAALAGYGAGLARYGPGPQAKTMAFMTLTTSQLLFSLTSRSQARLTDRGLQRNRLLERVVLVSLVAQYGTVLLPPLRAVLRTSPLAIPDLAITTALAAAPALLKELTKRASRPAEREPQAADVAGVAGVDGAGANR
jgi:Ca2+-transporting ATPase